MSGARLAVDERAISKEGMAAIAFGLTVLMIAISGGLLMQTSGNLSDGGPILTASAEPVDATTGPDGYWVRIEHETGSTVAVSNLTLNVSLPDQRKRASVHGLPTDDLQQTHYGGNHLFTLGPGGVEGAARANGTDGQWTAGEVIGIRIEPSRVELSPSDSVKIQIRHDDERKTLYSDTVSVT